MINQGYPNTASDTLRQDYSHLAMTNKLYSYNRDRWEFYLNSYTGGRQYQNGGYLTRYQLEQPGDYQARLLATPYQNHCQSVVQTYMSFLFRNSPERELEDWEYLPDVESFLKDCDWEGRSLNAFMKQTAIWASVFGHCWIIMTKPNVGATSMGEEQDMGVRPYVNLVTPLVVSDWRWERMPNGAYELGYLKYIEEVIDQVTVIKEWTKTEITTWIMYEDTKTAEMKTREPNDLGEIPAILVYNERSIERGLGVSDIADISDINRQIYNLTSEMEQAIRLDGHPSLVVPPTAQMGSGAGALIVLQDGSDPGLNPYYLESNGISVENIHKSIDKLVEAIDKIANTGGVRGTETRTLSGVAMEVEFQLLNARLSSKAANLELAEEQMWRLYGRYMGREWTGKIEYPSSFNIRDDQREFQQLQQAKAAATDPIVLKVIDGKILELLGEESELLAYDDINPIPGRTYPDGEAIADSLPPSYWPETDPEVPAGQNCGNCEYYNGKEGYCIKFDANVRPVYWCKSWDEKHDE